jgi:anaphase-promoting complex subunit 8
MDPFRLDEIEIYSNMLYVMNKKAKLAQIAHEYAQIDKNRAEVCCLIGKLPSLLWNAREKMADTSKYL